MSLTKKNLYFFFPSYSIGGVAILFLRLADYLSNSNLYNVLIIDYEDGYMAKNYDKDKNIQFIIYDEKKNIDFNNKDIIVFQSMPLWGIPKNLVFSKKTKLIYWNLHPYNMFGYAYRIDSVFKNKLLHKIVTLIFRYSIYFNDRKAVKIFDDKKSLFFMDEENLNQTKNWLDIKLKNKLYLPLSIDNLKNIKINYLPSKDNLTCAWIGRIGDFKVHILLYTLKKLNDIVIKTGRKLLFSIVGTGEYLEYLKEKTSSLNDINITFIDYIDPKNLNSFLKDIDLGFAMGTAALDFAKFGVPTILLDFSYKDIKMDYKFDWLYNTKNFTLGREINNTLYESQNKSLESLLNNLSTDYNMISLKSFNYIRDNFKIEKNANKFIDLVDKSSLTYSDLSERYFEMNRFHKLIGAKKYYND